MLRRFAYNNGLAANQVSDYDIKVELVRTKFSNIAAMTFSLNYWGWVIGSDMENFAYSQDGYEWTYTHCPGDPGVLHSLASVNPYSPCALTYSHIIAVGDENSFPYVKISTDLTQNWELHCDIMYDWNVDWSSRPESVPKVKWDDIQERWYVSFSDLVYSISPNDPFTVRDSEPAFISNEKGQPLTAITYHPDYGYLSAMPDGSIYKQQDISMEATAEEFSEPMWFALHDIEAIIHLKEDENLNWDSERRIVAVGGYGAIMEYDHKIDGWDYYWDLEHRTLRNITRIRYGYIATGDKGAFLFRPEERRVTEWIPLKLSVNKDIIGIGENPFMEKIIIAFSDGTVGHISTQVLADIFYTFGGQYDND